jgi:zinc transport system substrate-binding protein
VHVLAGPGQSPHTYDPTPRELAALAEARLWLRTGMSMENALAGRLERVATGLTVVDLRQGLDLLPETDYHDDGGHAAREAAMDAHVWLSARLVAKQATTAAAALGAATYPRGHLPGTRGPARLARLRRPRPHRAARPVRGRAFYVFHPAFAYFARDYGLRPVATEPAA